MFTTKNGARLVALVSLLAAVLFATFPQKAPAGNQIADQSGGAKVVWQKNLDASLRDAQQAKKLVLVDLYTDWCGWCHKLDRETYTNPQVIDYLNKKFICVKMNAEDGGQGEALAKQYNIKGYPCTIVLDATGKLRGKAYGYFTAKEYPGEVDKIAGRM